MDIVYDSHLLDRLKERNIPEEWPREIIAQADIHYHDKMTGNYVALKRISFKGKERYVAVVYTIAGSRVKAITAHPLQENQKESRVKSGRWIEVGSDR